MAAAGAQPSATDEAYENLSALLLEALDEFDQPPSATLPPPSVWLSSAPLPPPSERPCGGPHSPPRPSVACGFRGTLAALLLQAAWRRRTARAAAAQARAAVPSPAPATGRRLDAGLGALHELAALQLHGLGALQGLGPRLALSPLAVATR